MIYIYIFVGLESNIFQRSPRKTSKTSHINTFLNNQLFIVRFGFIQHHKTTIMSGVVKDKLS